MKDSQPLIEIIIPNWNGWTMLQDCLASLEKQSSGNFSVTVVDNGSTDASVENIHRRFPAVKCIVLPYNIGFSAGVNRGIEQATAEWMFLLNNDIEAAPDCIEAIENWIENQQGYDCLAVKMLNYHDRQYLDGAGDAYLRGGAGYRLGTMEKDSPLYSTSREVFGACAGAAVYSRRYFERAGLFDEDYFAYLEDVDLNLRAVRRNLKTYYLAEAKVYHIGSATTGSKINPFTIRQSTKNSLHTLTKNYPASLLVRFFPAIVVYQLLWFVFCVKKCKLISYLSGIIRAVCETPKMVQKRRDVLDNADNIGADAFGVLLKEAERDVIESIMSRRRSAGKSNTLFKAYCSLFL